MAKPPASGPSSDIGGVDRDWRPGLVSRDPDGQPAEQLKTAKDDSVARPDEDEGQGESGTD